MEYLLKFTQQQLINLCTSDFDIFDSIMPQVRVLLEKIELNGFWILRITGVLDFVHHPEF
jgi:hypothetical protein